MESLSHMERRNPVARADLRHSDWQHGYKAKLLVLDDGTRASLHHLESHIVGIVVELLLIVPQRVSSTCRHAWNLAQLTQCAIHRRMIAVVVVHVEERMSQRSASKSILVLRILANKLAYVGKFCCLDLQVRWYSSWLLSLMANVVFGHESTGDTTSASAIGLMSGEASSRAKNSL